MVLPELAGLTPDKLASAPPRELKTVDEQITKVLKDINEELTALGDSNFAVAAHIRKDSFGGGEPAQRLSVHYTKAHAVTVDMLDDLKKDLRGFRDAVRAARNLIREKDEEAQAELTLLLDRTNDFDMGSSGYRDGQQEHADTVPTNEMPTVEGDEA